MHTNRLELKEVYERVLNSRSPLDEFGKIVIENYGLWNPVEITDPTRIIKLQLCNIKSSGIGAEVALKFWLEKAAKALQE